MASDLSPGPGGALTRALSQATLDLSWADFPDPVRHEAKRCLVNYFACALAGWRDPAVTLAASVFSRIGPEGECQIIGSHRKVGALHAASLNAMAANVFDFDDTHMPTIVHPTSVVASVLFAMAQSRRVNGVELLQALVIGIEIQCRIAMAISPGHYARGWHITSTCGVFGAAAAASRLLGLNAQQTGWAFGCAASQASGLVESLGTMAKSIGVGNAASNGLLSALLAQSGFSGPAAPLEGNRGFVPVFGPEVNWEALTNGLGEQWEIQANTYKPYPCGVVLNPVIQACLALRSSVANDLDKIDHMILRAHPLLRQRTDRPNVTSGKLSQVSAQHAVAISLLRGRAGLNEFSDVAVTDPVVIALGSCLDFLDDASLGVEAAEITLTMKDGRSFTYFVEAAHGSVASPLTDMELSNKCVELAHFGGSGVEVEPLLKELWAIDQCSDVSTVMQLAQGGNAQSQ
jgi:hypothetical protein